MGRTMSFYDLRDALAQPGCAVCRLTAEATARYLDSLLWENVNDPGVRHDIRQARGFCHEHAWGLVRDGASLGVAIIMRDVLQEVLAILKEGKFQALPTLSLRRTQEVLDSSQPAAATAGLVRQLSPQSPCPACVQARTMENIYLSTLSSSFSARMGCWLPTGLLRDCVCPTSGRRWPGYGTRPSSRR